MGIIAKIISNTLKTKFNLEIHLEILHTTPIPSNFLYNFSWLLSIQYTLCKERLDNQTNFFRLLMKFNSIFQLKENNQSYSAQNLNGYLNAVST